MIEIGTLVRILQPNYVAGCKGIIEHRESKNGRWIIKLEENHLEKTQQPILLSLDKSDFKVL